MNILSVLILIGLCVVLFFQIKKLVILIKEKRKLKNARDETNTNNKKGVS